MSFAGIRWSATITTLLRVEDAVDAHLHELARSVRAAEVVRHHDVAAHHHEVARARCRRRRRARAGSSPRASGPRLRLAASAATTASPNSPSSRCRRDRASASMASAVSTACVEEPRLLGALPRPCSSIRTAERSIAAGFAIPWPAMSGAEPWIGSKMPGPGLAETRRRRQPDTARGHGGHVGEDVAERVLREQDVEAARVADELHRRVVDEHGVDLDVRVVGRDLVDDLAPELRRLEHAVLVGQRQPPAPAARELEGAARDPLDLPRVVLADVEHHPVSEPALAAVVETARELADDHHVDAVAPGPAAGSRRRRARGGAAATPARAAPPPARTRASRPRRAARRRRPGTPPASPAGSGSPHSRIPGPPNGRSSISSSSGSARSARIASRITSGPIPSPPRQTTVYAVGAFTVDSDDAAVAARVIRARADGRMRHRAGTPASAAVVAKHLTRS